jgi:succinate dehydrogenase / fumarate reductase, iron-sulfur subunit
MGHQPARGWNNDQYLGSDFILHSNHGLIGPCDEMAIGRHDRLNDQRGHYRCHVFVNRTQTRLKDINPAKATAKIRTMRAAKQLRDLSKLTAA